VKRKRESQIGFDPSNIDPTDDLVCLHGKRAMVRAVRNDPFTRKAHFRHEEGCVFGELMIVSLVFSECTIIHLNNRPVHSLNRRDGIDRTLPFKEASSSN
jgi:hypothetical protein